MTGSLQVKKDYYYIVLNYKDENGKRKQPWIATKIPVNGNNKRAADKSKKAADKMLYDRIREYEDTHIDLTNSSLFVDFLAEWLETLKANETVRETTYHEYKLLVNNSIIPFFKPLGLKLKDVTPAHIQKYYTYLQTRPTKSKKRDKGVSANTVKHHHANISKAFNYALKMNLIAYNPASRIDLPKIDRKVNTEKFYTEEQVKLVLDAVKDTTLYTPTFLAAHLGIRRSEVLGLKWSAIHFDDGDDSYIQIKRVLVEIEGEGVKLVDLTKTDKSYRTLYMNDTIKDYLVKLKARQEELKATLKGAYIDEGFVCAWEDGKLIRPGYVTETFPKELEKKAIPNFPVLNFHSLRHSAASMIINNSDGDITMKELSEFLGHSSITVTIDLYGHLQFKSKKKVGKLIETSLK